VNEWKNIDPTTWEFHLREGVRFHNGNELTAESVRFTMMDFILDQNRRKELYSQAQRRIIEQAYWMPTFLQYQIMAAKKDLEVSASPDEMVSFHHAYWK
jgi:ABC-type transport system substrate-binding protein